ncbi:MAG: outer membrane protein transport protein [Methylotenera sp.]|nr:outer membrane protein transport protein [Methylotenera sp.]
MNVFNFSLWATDDYHATMKSRTPSWDRKPVNYTSSLIQISITAMLALSANAVQAGPRGSEFDLTATPAAGGMEGVGIVRPQDPVAMIFGNPATMNQLDGSFSFTIGASFVSPDLEATNSTGADANPFVAPGAHGKSELDAAALPHAAVLHRVSPELVVGGGLTGISGLGSDFRDETGFPSLIADLKLFGANMAVAYQATPNWGVGAAFTLGIGALQAGLAQNSGTRNGFGAGFTLGSTYNLGPVMIGGTYKSPLNVQYDKVIESSPGKFSNLTLQQPQEVVLGISTSDSLLKDTLFELDFRYKNWDNATGYQDFWKDQYITSAGVQHVFSSPVGPITARAGYSYGTKLAKSAKDLGGNFAGARTVNVPGMGVVPVSPAFIQAAQATVTDGYWRQSVSVGLGYGLSKQVRLDVNGSYAFDGDTRIGGFDVDGKIWSAGMGLTWTFE